VRRSKRRKAPADELANGISKISIDANSEGKIREKNVAKLNAEPTEDQRNSACVVQAISADGKDTKEKSNLVNEILGKTESVSTPKHKSEPNTNVTPSPEDAARRKLIFSVLRYVVKGKIPSPAEEPESSFDSKVFAFLRAVEEARQSDDATTVCKLINEHNLVREHIPTGLLGDAWGTAAAYAAVECIF
jgi:hypothetical protein